MEYQKPQLRFVEVSLEMMCNSGSTAIGSGCTAGGTIGSNCGLGNSNFNCWDGSSAGGTCSDGTLAGVTLPRCMTGGTPAA